jgi:thiamine pyrophosphate-dependent acetolactate synthase large subunit-like protein
MVSKTMRRIEAIREIMGRVSDECVICSTGMICREVYEVKDRPRNFYMMGSMGSALGIGIGLAYTRPDLKVIVISGDGAILMNYGSLVLRDYLDLPNLKLIILDNHCHATTGGQSTCSSYIKRCYINDYYPVSNEKGSSPRITLEPWEITERFMKAIK